MPLEPSLPRAGGPVSGEWAHGQGTARARTTPGAPSVEARPVVYAAGFWRRTLAALLDLAILAPSGYLAVRVAGPAAGLELPSVRTTPIDHWLDLAIARDPALLGAVGLVIAVVLIYLLLFQTLAARTPGMTAVGLRIIDTYGDPPAAWRAALRTVGYVVAVATGSLGFVWVAFDREKRGLHDWLAGTYVIRSRPPAETR